MGPKSFVPKSSAEMMSPYFWVVAMTVVPEKLMFCAGVSSCGCPCLNIVDAVTGHSFPLSFPFTATPAASDTPLFQQHCRFSVHVAQPPPEGLCLCLRRQREKVSMLTPAIHFTSICLPGDLCSVPTRACHRGRRAVILELPNS